MAKTQTVVTAYRFDADGYYMGTDPVLEGMLPDDDTMTPPRKRDGHWSRWNGSSWDVEKIPDCAEDLEGMEVAHDDHSPHAEEVRELMARYASEEAVPGGHVLRRDPETMALRVEKVPDLTDEERAERNASAVRAERDRRLMADCDRVNAIRWVSMPAEERDAWIFYRQALLDIPQQEGFPWDGANVPWPTKPE